MVADGAHILLGLAFAMLVFRTRRAEPYLVAVLASSIPDSDKFVFTPLLRMGYVDGFIWIHRGITHSLLFGVMLVLVLSSIGPWRAAAVGFASHVTFDFLTGGVQLFAPFSSRFFGFDLGYTLMNVVSMVFAVTVLAGGLLCLYRPNVALRLLHRVGVEPGANTQ